MLRALSAQRVYEGGQDLGFHNLSKRVRADGGDDGREEGHPFCLRILRPYSQESEIRRASFAERVYEGGQGLKTWPKAYERMAAMTGERRGMKK